MKTSEQMGQNLFETFRSAWKARGQTWMDGTKWNELSRFVQEIWMAAAVGFLRLERDYEDPPPTISKTPEKPSSRPHCEIASHERLVNDNYLLSTSAAQAKSSEERYAAENARLRRENDDLRRRLGR